MHGLPGAVLEIARGREDCQCNSSLMHGGWDASTAVQVRNGDGPCFRFVSTKNDHVRSEGIALVSISPGKYLGTYLLPR